MPDIRPRRSVLTMPGSNARALEKARTLDADCILFDLEDAVAPEMKDMARAQVQAAIAAGGYGRRELVIRVNPLSTPWGAADIGLVGGADGVCLTKVNGPGEIAAARDALQARGIKPIPLWAMIETSMAVLYIREIAATALHERYPLASFIIGPNDLSKQTRAVRTPDRLALLTWISGCLLAARAFGVTMIDGVYNDFKDQAGYQADCALGRKLGMDGKQLIHPSQIAGANAAFGPTAEEIAWSRKIIAAFEQPENQGKGVIALDGEMVELLHADMARRTLALADAIGG
jgi:citrate lyase subunit beta/citryl-CoA lyase